MSQMRKDIFTDRWAIVQDGDELRPTHFHFKKFVRDPGFCPFCENNEAATPPEVFAIRSRGTSPNGAGWSVRVVPNSRPRLRIEGQLGRRAEALYDLMNGVGAHEIIVETARHDRSLHELEIEEISDVVRAYRARTVGLAGDNHVRYVLVFKNHGEGAGAHTISHSISQLIALPVTPRAVKTKLMIARDYFALKERCIYCDVLHQELKGRKRLIADNDDFVAFAPFASRFPFEMAVFPKFHSSAFGQISETQIEHLAHILRDVLRKLDQTLGGPPYNLSLHDRPVLRQRRGYWNTIEEDFHWHIEILPQMFRITGFEWASGFFFNPVPPEVAARCLIGGPTPEQFPVCPP
jgi:UDPglucose--hexose-1-phosphate uridylyltransferase